MGTVVITIVITVVVAIMTLVNAAVLALPFEFASPLFRLLAVLTVAARIASEVFFCPADALFTVLIARL